MPETFQGRINRLESLVVQLLQRTEGEPPASPVCSRCLDPLPDTVASPASSDVSLPGNLQQDAAKTVYVGNTHWRAVMDGISDLKSLCERDVVSPGSVITDEVVDCAAPKPPSNRMGLLFMSPVPVSRREILAALPDRAETDRLIATYFHNASIPHRKLSE